MFSINKQISDIPTKDSLFMLEDEFFHRLKLNIYYFFLRDKNFLKFTFNLSDNRKTRYKTFKKCFKVKYFV